MGTDCACPKGWPGDWYKANVAILVILQFAGKAAQPHDASRYDQTCWVKAHCLKNYLLTLNLLLSQGQHMLDLRWGRPMGYHAFPSPEVARNLQQELPWELDSALLWTPSPAALGTAGKKNPTEKAHIKKSGWRKTLCSAGSKHVLVKELDYSRRWLTQ